MEYGDLAPKIPDLVSVGVLLSIIMSNASLLWLWNVGKNEKQVSVACCLMVEPQLCLHLGILALFKQVLQPEWVALKGVHAAQMLARG